MNAAWFVDGAYAFKTWQYVSKTNRLDFVKLRKYLEDTYLDTANGEEINDAYYFNADQDSQSAKQNSFHSALTYPPPNGPGLRVKLYWLQERELFWPAHMGGGAVVHPETGMQYKQSIQKAVDVGIAFHLIRSFTKRQWKKLFFLAGDSDFHEAVQHLVEHEDVELILIGTISTMSQELRPYARSIVELDKIADIIGR
jgi:uncharacterized LabA/DUF88 family protein